jgi:large subunit ribosomal protein L24
LTINKIHVKKGDTVVVISGKDKDKKGKVLRVLPSDGKVIVEGANMATKHKKANKKVKQGGIIHQEAPLYASKVAVYCPNCNEGRRVGHTVLNDGKKVRKCVKCGEIIETDK